MSAKTLGLVLAVLGCGGGEPKQQQQQQPPPAQQPAAAPAAGAVVEVRMTGNGRNAATFEPAELTIAPGTTVKFINVSGGPHNVQFWPDSIPAGAADALSAGMPQQMSPLAGPLVVEPNGTYTVNFANTPAGEYKYYCLPHLANKMVARITVTQ